MPKRTSEEKIEGELESSVKRRITSSDTDPQIPSTAKEVVDKSLAHKMNKSAKPSVHAKNSVIENPIVPSDLEIVPTISGDVSRDVIVLNKNRMDYNFWSKLGSDNTSHSDAVNNVTTDIKIHQLFIGKISNRILKIRITYISEIRNTQIGPVLTFHGKDEFNEIAVVNFGKNCQLLYNFLKIRNTISIKTFSVNEENVEYPSGSGNNLEIRINKDSLIEEVEDDKNIPDIFFKFIPLSEVQTSNQNDRIDVIGILFKNFGLEKNHKGTVMRELALTNTAKENLIVTLWTVHAEKFCADQFAVIVIRKGVVTEYEGKKKLNCIGGTLVLTSPDIPEALELSSKFREMSNNIL